MASSFHTSWSSILGEKEINREKKKQEKIFHDAWDSINEEKWKHNLKIAKDRKTMTKRVNEYLTQQSETALKTKHFNEINDAYSSLQQFDHNLGKTIPSVVNDSANQTVDASVLPTQKQLKNIQQPSNSKRRKYIRDCENSSYTAYRAQLDNQISYKVSYSSTQECLELTEVNSILTAIERLTGHREQRDVLIRNLKLENKQKLKNLFHELSNRYDSSLLKLESDLNKKCIQSCNDYDRDVGRSIAKSTIDEIIDDVVHSVDWVSNWKTFSILNYTLDSSINTAKSTVDSPQSEQLFQDVPKLLKLSSVPISSIDDRNDMVFKHTKPPLSLITSLIKPIHDELVADSAASSLRSSDDPDVIMESVARNESVKYFNSLGSIPLSMEDDAVASMECSESTYNVSSDKDGILEDSDWIMRTDSNTVIGEVLLRIDHFKNKATTAVLESTPTVNTVKGLYPYPCRIVLSCLKSTMRSQFAKLLKSTMPYLVLVSVEELLIRAIDHGRDLISSECDVSGAPVVAASDQSAADSAATAVEMDEQKGITFSESAISKYVQLAKQVYTLVRKGLPVTDDIYTSLVLHRLQELSDATWSEEEKASGGENIESAVDASTAPHASTAPPSQHAYGWVLYDYPNTRSQALALTKALSSGIDYDDAGRQPQINDKGSKIHFPKAREPVYTDLTQCGLTSFIILDTTGQENCLYANYEKPPSAVMKEDLHRFLEMVGDADCDANDIVNISAHTNHQFHQTTLAHVSSQAELLLAVPSVDQFTPAGSIDVFIKHKEMLYMEELFQRLSVSNKYSIDVASNLSDTVESVYSQHRDRIKSFVRKVNWSRDMLPGDLLDSEFEQAVADESLLKQELSSTSGTSENLSESAAATAQVPNINLNSKAASKISSTAPSNKANAELVPKPVPSIFSLHEILADLWNFTEKRSFDQASHVYHTFRATRLRYMHRRHLVYHNLIAVLNQKESRNAMIEGYVQEFNSKEYDAFRFESPFKEEMMLRNYELFSNLHNIASVRKQDAIKYISQICADNVVNLMLATVYIPVVYFIQTEYMRFIANLGIFLDYVKTMTDVSAELLTPQATEAVITSFRVPNRQLLEETLADYDTGEGKKAAGKAKPKDAKVGKDMSGAPRNPVPTDDALPGPDEWKALLPDAAVITAITSCIGLINSGVTPAAAGGDKKGKAVDAKAGDKNKKGAVATTATTPGHIATTYNNSALSALLHNVTRKLEDSVNATWGATIFTVNRALYGDNQELCERIEKTVRNEAKRFISQVAHISNEVEGQAQVLVGLDESFTLYLQENVAEKFHVLECDENVAICRSIETAIDNSTTITGSNVESTASVTTAACGPT